MKTTGVAAAAFGKWLVNHPVAGDQPFGRSGARYQVARYCEYLGFNPWPRGNPLMDAAARDGAVSAYLLYLGMFAPAETIERAIINIDHFYAFLGMGPALRSPSMGALQLGSMARVTSTA